MMISMAAELKVTESDECFFFLLVLIILYRTGDTHHRGCVRNKYATVNVGKLFA